MSNHISPCMGHFLMRTAVFGIGYLRQNAKQRTIDALISRGLLELLPNGSHRLTMDGYAKACRLWDEQIEEIIQNTLRVSED